MAVTIKEVAALAGGLPLYRIQNLQKQSLHQ